MAVSDQLKKLKENWLLILLPIALLFVFFVLVAGINSGGFSMMKSASLQGSRAAYDSVGYGGGAGGYPSESYAPSVPSNSNFAPGVTERKVVKSSSLGLEVEQGKFDSAQAAILNVVKSSNSILLTSNANENGEKGRSYHNGYYTIKVVKSQYDGVIAQLKQLGEVKSFNENAQDVTGQYVDTNIELAAEQDRLSRYQAMLKDATIMQDKIMLSDKIFDQQRQIEYLKDSLKNQDRDIEYSTVSVTLNEKPPTFYDVVVVSFKTLLETLVNSFNGLLLFVVAVLPWAIAAALVWFVVRLVRRH